MKRLDSLTWWILAIAVAVAVAVVNRVLISLAAIVLSAVLILMFAPRQTKSTALRVFGLIAISVVALRVLFRVAFSGNSIGAVGLVVVNLPSVKIPGPFGTIDFLGPVTADSLIAGLTDGTRLAAMIALVALAGSVANPRQLLKHTPEFLYQFSVALLVALNLAPQLVQTVKRVQLARRLRGESVGLASFGKVLVPVMEDALSRSLALAASMESRGFGAPSLAMPRQLTVATWLTISSVSFIAFAGFSAMAGFSNTPTIATLLVTGSALLWFAVRSLGKHDRRTRYTPTKLATGSSLATAEDSYRWINTVARLLAIAVVLAAVAARIWPQLLGWGF